MPNRWAACHLYLPVPVIQRREPRPTPQATAHVLRRKRWTLRSQLVERSRDVALKVRVPAAIPFENVRRCGGPFLKEFVKRKQFPSGLLRNGSARRNFPLFIGSLGAVNRANLPSSLLRDPSRLSSLREVAIVLFRRDCSQHIPSQGTTHDNREQLCLVSGQDRCGFIWCEFLTGRATPSKASCCWPRPLLVKTAASTVRLELAQTGGISSCHQATPIEQPGRILLPHDSSLFCSGRHVLLGDYNTLGLGGG